LVTDLDGGPFEEGEIGTGRNVHVRFRRSEVMRKLILLALGGMAWRWFQKRNRAATVRRGT
jgi:hypothetical protein